MREIKFRVWDSLKKEYLNYPCYFNHLDFNEFTCFDRYFKCDEEKCIVQQFTGLLDKNGKDIYEGDIVNTIYPSNPLLNIGDVIFDKETCAFRIKTIKHLLPIVTLRFVDDKPQGLLQVADEVVGNIFENPELCVK